VACTGQMLASDTLTGATAASCGAWCASATRSHSNGRCCALQTATELCSLHAGDVSGGPLAGSKSCLLEPTAALDGTYQCPTGSHSHAAKAVMLAAWPREGEPAVAPSTLEEAVSVLSEMRANGYTDRYTRAVIVDFTVADTQLGLISAVKVMLEFSTQGRVVGSYSAKTVRHVPLFELGAMQAWFEGFVGLMVFLYLADEMRDLIKYLLLKSRAQTQITLSILQGLSPPAWTNIPKSENYLADPWNAIDILNYVRARGAPPAVLLERAPAIKFANIRCFSDCCTCCVADTVRLRDRFRDGVTLGDVPVHRGC
jgi:hypothetical protein